MRRLAHAGLVLALTTSVNAHAELTVSGNSGVELRAFTQSGALIEQDSRHQFSTFGSLELDYELANGDLRFVGFGRADSIGGERSHVDIREAYWETDVADVDVLLGINKVFWGVTESRHLVNVINTTDASENIDDEDTLGQPMLNLTWNTDLGALGVFVLPMHRPTPFVNGESRFRLTSLPINDDAMYRGGASEDTVSAALRYAHYIGDWDVGLHYFYGVNREPTAFDANGDITVTLDSSGQPVVVPNSLTPVYDLIHQGGVDAQLTLDAWLYKLEAIWRQGQGDTFAAVTGGFEYAFYQVFNSDRDLGVLLEYSYDGRTPDTVMDDDVFVGARLAWNDMNDTALLAGVITDVNDGSTSLRIEAERRIGESLTLELESQWFTQVDDENPMAAFERDDFVALNLIRYF